MGTKNINGTLNVTEAITINGQAIGGIDIVELDSSSGYLSDSDFAKVNTDTCLIKYQDRYYYKERITTESVNYCVITLSEDNSSKCYAFSRVGILANKRYIVGNVDIIPILAPNSRTGAPETILSNIQIANRKYKVNYNNLAPEYDSTSTYAVGDLCIKDGNLYSCNTAILVAEAWDATHWTLTDVASAILGMINVGY